ncbi:hypothetical protein [Ferrimonas aestuarii]|uniref:Lipoprotein n=1 Tax=Ferrimonas aestuarii TaxID=2569539 RepID=A0A4U1BXN0_9GAMM|nr:hypothetical protein [Ferrimonas aestuarii]TKB58485.1 hypothetical protein FCL42_01695 [Ferrimonas aestuarii]
MIQLTNSKLQKLMLVLLVAFGVSACGGGGGGGGDSSTPEAPAPIDDSSGNDDTDTDDNSGGESEPEAEPETPGLIEPDMITEELIASDVMDFKASEPVMVSINMASGETAYASVYMEFSETPEGYLPSYQQRMVSGPLTNGQLELLVSVGKERTHLLIEIWFYDPQIAPLQKVFALNSNRLEWEI